MFFKVRSASFILLQGVPSTVSLDEVRDSILSVEGVLSVHELHVWQLSESKIVASVHVLASRNHDFMPIAVKIRKVMHHLGIHSCTIQPEYYHPNTTIPDEHLKVSFYLRSTLTTHSNSIPFSTDYERYVMSYLMSARRILRSGKCVLS